MILKVCAKCSDLCSMELLADDKTELGNYSGYVPVWLPNTNVKHYSNYVELTIDTTTGKIIDWTPPTKKQIKETFGVDLWLTEYARKRANRKTWHFIILWYVDAWCHLSITTTYRLPRSLRHECRWQSSFRLPSVKLQSLTVSRSMRELIKWRITLNERGL